MGTQGFGVSFQRLFIKKNIIKLAEFQDSLCLVVISNTNRVSLFAIFHR